MKNKDLEIAIRDTFKGTKDLDAKVQGVMAVVRASSNTGSKLYIKGSGSLPGKCAIQMRQLYQALTEEPSSGTDIADRAISEHGMKTRQEPIRIFAWYRKQLLECKAMIPADSATAKKAA